MQPGWKLIGVIPDSAWDTAAVTFQITVDATNYFDVYNEGVEYSLPGVLASDYNRVDMAMFYGARAIKVRSGTSGTAVNQVDDSIVTLVFWQLE